MKWKAAEIISVQQNSFEEFMDEAEENRSILNDLPDIGDVDIQNSFDNGFEIDIDAFEDNEEN